MRRLIPYLMFALMFPVLLGLGFWQLDRAKQKETTIKQIEVQNNRLPQQISNQEMDTALANYSVVKVTGEYLPRFQFLVDNKVHKGRAGYHVITPLVIDGGDRLVLVNRGWVSSNDDRTRLPTLETPAGKQKISGTAVIPADEFFRLSAAEEINDSWPVVWQYLNIHRFADAVPFPIQPFVILLGSEHESGFVREWQLKSFEFGPERHRGYALTWFSLAGLLLVLSIIAKLKAHKHRKITAIGVEKFHG